MGPTQPMSTDDKPPVASSSLVLVDWTGADFLDRNIICNNIR